MNRRAEKCIEAWLDLQGFQELEDAEKGETHWEHDCIPLIVETWSDNWEVCKLEDPGHPVATGRGINSLMTHLKVPRKKPT